MTQSPTKMTTRLRQFLDAPGLIRAVNVYDPLTARIAESLGFQAIALGGFQLGAQLCTTEPLLTMTEVSHSARYVTQAVHIPLKVDCARNSSAIHYPDTGGMGVMVGRSNGTNDRT